MSKSTLNRKVSEIGYTPAELILYYRMEFAKQMLELNTHSIEEVARQSGFSGITAFSRRFSQEFNMNPSEYRRKIVFEQSEPFKWKIPFTENHFNQLIEIKKKMYGWQSYLVLLSTVLVMICCL